MAENDDDARFEECKYLSHLLLAEQSVVVLFLDVNDELLGAYLEQLGQPLQALDRHDSLQRYSHAITETDNQ